MTEYVYRNMKEIIQGLLSEALIHCNLKGKIQVSRPKDPTYGDYSSNIALVLAKPYQHNPQQLASSIVSAIAPSVVVARIEIAAPGFINFFMHKTAVSSVLAVILQQGDSYGWNAVNFAQRKQIPFFPSSPAMNGEIQYAHARICIVFRQLLANGLAWDADLGLAHVQELTSPHETALMTLLCAYPDVIMQAIKKHEVVQIMRYLRELAKLLQNYYNDIQLIDKNEGLRSARMCLLSAIRCVLKNGLTIMGISAPESM